jgi:hypothetical protein
MRRLSAELPLFDAQAPGLQDALGFRHLKPVLQVIAVGV